MKHLQFKIFKQYGNIKTGISTRDFGSMKNEDNSINRDNLQQFLKYLNLSKNGVCMEQVHGGNVSRVNDNNNLLLAQTDGLVTDKKNIPLCVVTADCLPILFYDPAQKVIGIAHGGRKGLLSGIIKKTVEKFRNEYQSKASDIKVGIGAGIEKKCYEVDGELFDLRNIAHKQLIFEGISTKNIETLDICTKCSLDILYSYRGGSGTNRFVTIISMQ